MNITLGADGQIGIPQQIRDADHLAAGDSFDLQRLTPGHYLLAKRPSTAIHFQVAKGDDGLPIIQATHGSITSQLVKEIESQTP